MKTFFALALAALAVASPVELVARASTASPPTSSPGAKNIIYNDKVIGNDSVTLTNAFNAVPDNGTYTFFQLLALQAASNQILNDLKNQSTAVNASSKFNAADTSSINSAYNKLLPTVKSALQAVASHKPAVVNQGLNGSVVQGLQQQRELSREIINGVISRGSGSATTAAPAASKTVISLFNSVLSVYSAH